MFFIIHIYIYPNMYVFLKKQLAGKQPKLMDISV